jgi:hypothetical protein
MQADVRPLPEITPPSLQGGNLGFCSVEAAELAIDELERYKSIAYSETVPGDKAESNRKSAASLINKIRNEINEVEE